MSYLSPKEVYQTMVESNTLKTKSGFLQTSILGFLGGAYVALGGLTYTIATTGTTEKLGAGASKIIGGIAFSLGLILVMLAGAQLFTGNTLIFGSFMEKQVSILKMIKNWILVYFTNLFGSLVVAFLVYFAGIYGYSNKLNAFGENILNIAEHKLELSYLEIFTRAIFANWFVCLAVYLSYSAKDITGKILAIVFPVMAFVAVGLEHSVANMFLLPSGLFLSSNSEKMNLSLIFQNISIATLGNIVGGAFFVATLYFWAYKDGKKSEQS